MRLAPIFIWTISSRGFGLSLLIAKLMINAGISQLTREGMKMAKNSIKSTFPFCQTIRVVMSPKGEKAPPALAATTMLMQARTTKRRFPAPTAMTTAPISRAVVRLSATGEMKKASRPVSQKMVRRENPRETSQPRRALKTLRSSRELM